MSEQQPKVTTWNDIEWKTSQAAQPARKVREIDWLAMGPPNHIDLRRRNFRQMNGPDAPFPPELAEVQS